MSEVADGKLCRHGSAQRRRDGEVGKRERLAADPAAAGKMRIENAGELTYQPFAAADFGRIGRAEGEHALDDVLPVENADGRREMLRAPEEPAVDVGACAGLRRVERLAWSLVGQVLHDGMRFP